MYGEQKPKAGFTQSIKDIKESEGYSSHRNQIYRIEAEVVKKDTVSFCVRGKDPYSENREVSIELYMTAADMRALIHNLNAAMKASLNER